MKLDPGMHIGMHLVFFRKAGVTWGYRYGRTAPGGVLGIRWTRWSKVRCGGSPDGVANNSSNYVKSASIGLEHCTADNSGEGWPPMPVQCTR
jgi:hypothetical protein